MPRNEQTAKPRTKYAAPALLKLDAPSARGACSSGSSDVADCIDGFAAAAVCDSGLSAGSCSTGTGP